MENLVTIITTVIAIASLVANITPSSSDNEFLAKLDKLIQALALNLRKDK